MPRTQRSPMSALKREAIKAIDGARDDLVRLAKEIYREPEVGFEERRTAAKTAAALDRLGLSSEQGIALTGVKATKTFAHPGPRVAVIGELDGLRVPGHPAADPDTGAAHACGHHAEIAQMIGVAAALSRESIAKALAGSVAFIATPAEEFIDVEQRLVLREAGEIEFLSGKQEMIRLGAFDDVDMAMMVHTTAEGPLSRFAVGGTSNAHVVHRVVFEGRAAHAGGAPWEGVNALQAATLALTAVNTQRETFEEKDSVRVHGIITEGGTSVNSVPSSVVYEGRVRAASLDAVGATADKVERCFKAGALALGGAVQVTRLAGYHALENDTRMQDCFAANVEALLGKNGVLRRSADSNRGGSTDMGDLSQIMPVIHPYVSSASGSAHGIDYLIADYDAAVLNPAKAMAMTVIDLLSDEAQLARQIVANRKPALTAKQYVELQRSRTKEFVYRAT